MPGLLSPLLAAFLMKVLVLLMRTGSLDIAQISFYLHFRSLACQQLRWSCRPNAVFTQEGLREHLEGMKSETLSRRPYGCDQAHPCFMGLGMEIHQQVHQGKTYFLNLGYIYLTPRPRKFSSPFSPKGTGGW